MNYFYPANWNRSLRRHPVPGSTRQTTFSRRVTWAGYRRGAIRFSTVFALVLLFLAGGIGLASYTGQLSFGKTQRIKYVTEQVKRGPLEIAITERGNLDSAANVTLISKVEGTTTIIRIVEEGTSAKQGQVLVELDSSKLRDQETQQRIVVEQADAALKQAIEKRAIQITQNESDINAADLKKTLADLDLNQYEKGDFVKERDDLKGKETLAQEELKRAQESYDFQKENAKKGYVSQSALEAARISVFQKKLALDVARQAVRVLLDYTYKRQIAEKVANKTEFEKELERVKRKATAAMAQADADLSACRLTAEVEDSKLKKLREQIANCSLTAPQDGEVVYANTSSDRRGGSDQVVIQEGSQVRERQAIINLPDFSRMQVNAKIHESRIGFVREGLHCIVKTEANHGETFNGVIYSVSSVPLSGNWPNRDLKEYSTVVRLTDPVEKVRKLKPGLSAEVQIKVDYIPSCLTVPVQSVVTIGPKHYAFPLKDGVPTTVEVEVGKTNDIELEIKSGLEEGMQVLMNPRTVAFKEISRLEDEAKAEEVRLKAEEAKQNKSTPNFSNKGAAPVLGQGSGKTFPLPGGADGVGGGPRGSRGPGGPGGNPAPGTAGADRLAASVSPGGPPGPGGPSGNRGPGGGGMRRGFADMDADGDGKLKGDEVPRFMQSRIADVDTDNDGGITEAELNAFREKMQSQQSQNGGGRPDGPAASLGGTAGGAAGGGGQ